MRFFLLYATSQGQTTRIVDHVADRLRKRGHEALICKAQDLGTDTGIDTASHGCDAAILAGSVHAGRYQDELARAARHKSESLNGVPGLFLSVSLTAAGDDPAEHVELDRLANEFLTETGWNNARIVQVAGALRFLNDDFFEYWAKRWIARQHDRRVSGRSDIELTDWHALDAEIEGFIASVKPRDQNAAD